MRQPDAGGSAGVGDLQEDVGKHWRDYGRLSDEQIGDVFRTYFWAGAPRADRSLMFDPAP